MVIDRKKEVVICCCSRDMWSLIGCCMSSLSFITFQSALAAGSYFYIVPMMSLTLNISNRSNFVFKCTRFESQELLVCSLISSGCIVSLLLWLSRLSFSPSWLPLVIFLATSPKLLPALSQEKEYLRLFLGRLEVPLDNNL